MPQTLGSLANKAKIKFGSLYGAPIIWIKADKKPALNVDLWQELLPLLETHRVSWKWVKGHADNAKNNRCDELAVAQSRAHARA